MKANAHTLRACQFEANEKKRKVRDLEAMIEEFRQMVVNLDHQILSEEEKSGISDKNHYAYPTFAKAAIQRRDNLIVSLEDLQAKLDLASEEMQVATDDLNKAQQLDRRESGVSKKHTGTHQVAHRF